MTTILNKKLWDDIARHQREVSILKTKLGQLSIQDQVEILKYAFSMDDEKNVWDHLMRKEPINYRKSHRELTKGLFKIILGTAVYPDDFELEARSLLKALVIDFPQYGELIYSDLQKYLDEADKTSDYEVYESVCNLLIDINSVHLDQFLQRCREHSSEEVREIDEDWDD